MNRLLIILLALSYTSVFAHGGEGHINLGDKASELEDEGNVVNEIPLAIVATPAVAAVVLLIKSRNIQYNDVIGLVLRENCKSNQVIAFIA
jgi:hypothetical protein